MKKKVKAPKRKHKKQPEWLIDTFPYPVRALTTYEDVRTFTEGLIFNCMEYLQLSGYKFYVVLPGEKEYKEIKEAGASVDLEYPYKRFKIILQETSVNNVLAEKNLTAASWKNFEKMVFHECLHIVLWHLTQIGEKRFISGREIDEVNETTTDHLTHVIQDLVWRCRDAARPL